MRSKLLPRTAKPKTRPKVSRIACLKQKTVLLWFKYRDDDDDDADGDDDDDNDYYDFDYDYAYFGFSCMVMLAITLKQNKMKFTRNPFLPDRHF